MALITVDLCFHQIGTLAGTSVFHSHLHCLIDFGGVGAVHHSVFYAVSSSTGGQIRSVGHAMDLGRDAIAVVLNEPDHGQMPSGSHVQRFMEGAFIGGAIPEAAYADGVITHDLGSQSTAGGDELASTNDAVCAQVVHLLHISDVHGAALALTIAGDLAEQLSHSQLSVCTSGDCVAMTTMGGSEIIFGLDGCEGACFSCLLTDAQMNVACQHALGEAVCCVLFKCTNPNHSPVKLHQLIFCILFFCSQ